MSAPDPMEPKIPPSPERKKFIEECEAEDAVIRARFRSIPNWDETRLIEFLPESRLYFLNQAEGEYERYVEEKFALAKEAIEKKLDWREVALKNYEIKRKYPIIYL